MDDKIFEIVPLRKKSVFQSIFKQNPDENGVIMLNNLLAEKSILAISEVDIAKIEVECNINLYEQFPLNLEEFYATYLGNCLKRNTVTDDELKDLANLKTILKLSNKTVSFLHVQLGEQIFRNKFAEAISDGIFNDRKDKYLTDLATRMGLPKELTDSISADLRKGYVKNFVSKIISDERFSPDDERQLESLKKNLNVDFKYDDQLRWKLQKLKLYWELENLPLPIIQQDILLQKNECCHVQISGVQWYELRKVTQRVGYTGFSTSIKIAKGFYLRSGSYAPHSYTTEQMKLIDSGTLYLTNKRIIFGGRVKNSNILLGKIIGFTPYNDGVEISKDTGKSPLLKISNNADVFCMILGRLLNDRV